MWAGFSDEPVHLRNDPEPLPNQPFYHACVLVLGVAMIVLSLWGLWLDKPWQPAEKPTNACATVEERRFIAA